MGASKNNTRGLYSKDVTISGSVLGGFPYLKPYPKRMFMETIRSPSPRGCLSRNPKKRYGFREGHGYSGGTCWAGDLGGRALEFFKVLHALSPKTLNPKPIVTKQYLSLKGGQEREGKGY